MISTPSMLSPMREVFSTTAVIAVVPKSYMPLCMKMR